jgi:hypothetical protein
MSEKGQGEESTAGTGSGVGVDGTPAGVGGSQADQTGPQAAEPPTDEAIEEALKAYEDRERERTFLEGLGKPEIPDAPEDPNPPKEPSLPGGGPTDTRSGWDYPEGVDGPRGEERPYSLPGGSDDKPSQPSSAEGQAVPSPWDGGLFGTPPDIPDQPGSPSAPTDRPPGMSEEEFRKWREAHPTLLDKANTQTDVT